MGNRKDLTNKAEVETKLAQVTIYRTKKTKGKSEVSPFR